MRINFDNLPNARDLGGMKTKDGRTIKNGMLIRCGMLYSASENDKKRLSEMLSYVFDFRTIIERDEKPDPELDGVKNIHISILGDSKFGVTRDKKSEEAIKQMAKAADPNIDPVTRMANVYVKFVKEPAINERYKNFLNQVYENDKKAVLWHCSAGKDRAGMGAILLEYILGVSVEDIKADYLFTNECIKEENERLLATVFSDKTDEEKKNILPALQAREEYFDAVFNTANEMYGSFDAFLEKALGIGEKEIKAFRDKFTE